MPDGKQKGSGRGPDLFVIVLLIIAFTAVVLLK